LRCRLKRRELPDSDTCLPPLTLTSFTPLNSKSDLLVKTRFLNPIPAPACPPQTIEIPTDLARMGKADLTSAYAASLPMPMMVDSEIGMPLDLNACAGIWWDEVDSGKRQNDCPLLSTRRLIGNQLNDPRFQPLETCTDRLATSG
jgi:hypothetical protein